MQTPTVGLGDRPVDDVADDHVPKAKGASATRSTLPPLEYEVALHGEIEAGVTVGCLVAQRHERLAREVASGDAGLTEHVTHRSRQAVEPRRHDALQRGGDGARVVAL